MNFILILLAAYIVLMQVCPDKIKNLIGYQPFVILTDSMEPLIPTGSAVLVKNFKEGEEPEEGSIISFHVDRLGTPTVFTHYFRKKEVGEDGRIRYRTQGLSADQYDDYETYREDLIGTYVGHVPYVGRFILFLQSPFALIEFGIILFLMVIYHVLWDKFDREEKMALETGESEEEDICDGEILEEEIPEAEVPEAEPLGEVTVEQDSVELANEDREVVSFSEKEEKKKKKSKGKKKNKKKEKKKHKKKK